MVVASACIVLCLLSAISGMASSEETENIDCGAILAGSSYSPCANPCPSTCDIPTPLSECYRACRAGCQCEKGKVIHPDGRCADPQECPLVTSAPPNVCEDSNEVYSSCGTCEESCESYGHPVECSNECVAGCFCKPDLVRNASGVCVKPNDCCDSPDEILECGCEELTCDNLTKFRDCSRPCKAACVCRPGLVRDFAGGTCVFPVDCLSLK